MASKYVEFEIDKDETDPDLTARAATNFLFNNAEKEAKEFMEKDEKFKKLSQGSKYFCVKMITNSIVERTIDEFKKEIEKKKDFFLEMVSEQEKKKIWLKIRIAREIRQLKSDLETAEKCYSELN